MADPAAKRAFVLALSHREKANALKMEADQALAAGRLEPSRHAALHDFYTKHLQDAEAHLARLQEVERRTRDSLQHQLRATINNRARMVERAMAGRLEPAKANELNRQYQREIEALEARIAACDELLNAAVSADLGEFADLPLESYVPVDAQALPPLDRWESRRWAIVVAALFVFTLLLFLVLRRGPAGTDIEASFARPEPGVVQVTVTNNSARSIQFYAPWPDAPSLAEDVGTAFGLSLNVIEEGQETYKLLPASDVCWASNGYAVSNPLELHPKIPGEVTLDLACLQRLATRPTSVQVVLTSPRGRVLAQEKFGLRQSPG